MISDHQQNLSIELEDQPSNFDDISMAKCDEQLTQELYQIARKIAESDRNNEVLRTTKKTKLSELDTLRRTELDKQMEYEEIYSRIQNKKKQLSRFGSEQCFDTFNNASNNKNNNYQAINLYQQKFYNKTRKQLQSINKQVQNLEQKEKKTYQASIETSKESQKLQRKISALQIEYQLLLKQNKHKNTVLNKLKQQKEEKNEKVDFNQLRISQLEDKCEESKSRAEQLENQLREQLKISTELQEIIRQREQELELRNKQREETQRKKQQNKRTVNKLVITIKSIQNEIEEKLKQADRLEQIHKNLQQKILDMQTKQRKLDQIMNRRKSIISTLKSISRDASQQEEIINKLRNNESQHESEDSYN